MPSRTPVRPQQKRVTNADLAEAIRGIKAEIAEVKEVVKTAGLNGYSADFKAMVEEWRRERQVTAARGLLRAERVKNWAWVRGPWRFISLLLSAVIGAFGWRIVSGVHIPW